MNKNIKTNTVRANPKAGKGPLGFIFSVVLLDVIGLAILMPVQAYIVHQYSDEAIMVAMIPVLYAGAQFFAAPLLGKLSDRYGRRPVLLISILGSALGYFLFGIGGALWVLFLSRLIDGFTAGNASTAGAYIADVTPPQDRAKNYGFIGMAYGLGFILGPMLGGLLSEISLNAPAYAAGILSLLSAVVGYFILPESLPKEKREKTPLRLADLNPFASVFELLRRPTVGGLLLTQCLFFFVFNGNNNILPVFMIEKFAVQPWQIAVLFAVGGVTMAGMQGGLVGPLVKRFGEKPLAVNSLLLQAVATIGMVAVPALWMLYPIGVINSLGTGLIWPTLGALLANSVSYDEQGKVSGVGTALGSLMSVFGPLWAGAAYDSITPVAPFWIGAVIFVLAGLLLARVKVKAHENGPIDVHAMAD
jgi:DHA1 family tetracycline resistance protein-like MFS transporter